MIDNATTATVVMMIVDMYCLTDVTIVVKVPKAFLSIDATSASTLLTTCAVSTPLTI